MLNLEKVTVTNRQTFSQIFEIENLGNRYGASLPMPISKQISEIYIICVVKNFGFSQNDAKKWCQKNNPILRVFHVDLNIETVYTYKRGFQGEQYQLFKQEKTSTTPC
jgi:hypothetical protein